MKLRKLLCDERKGCQSLKLVGGKLQSSKEIIILDNKILTLPKGESAADLEKGCFERKVRCAGGLRLDSAMTESGDSVYQCCPRDRELFYNDTTDKCMCVSEVQTFSSDILLSEEDKKKNDIKLGIIRDLVKPSLSIGGESEEKSSTDLRPEVTVSIPASYSDLLPGVKIYFSKRPRFCAVDSDHIIKLDSISELGSFI